MNHSLSILIRRLGLMLALTCGLLSHVAAEQQTPLSSAEIVSDPIQDFLASRSRNPQDSLYVLELDLSGSGKKEVFLSYSHNVDGKAGNVWTPYIPAKGGYQRSDQLLTFDTRTLFVGYNKDLNITGLITYYPGGGRVGMLTGYTFDGQRFKQSDTKPIEPSGKDAERFKRLFTTPSKYKPETLTPEQLPATTYH